VFDSSTGFVLPDKSMLSPDASWVEKSRWESLTTAQQEKFAPLCPDFVMELKSPSDSIKYLKDKMKTWIKNGCRLAWLIDPESKEVTIYRVDGSVELKAFNENLDGENVLPGFSFDLTKLG
jgi:Uma2 family endonuclease